MKSGLVVALLGKIWRAGWMVAAGSVILMWLLTGIAIVPATQLGLYWRLGRRVSEPLGPGVHFLLPRPFGQVRYLSVGRPVQQRLGFAQSFDTSGNSLESRPAGLCTVEVPVVQITGTANELIQFTASVVYCLSSSSDRLAEYVEIHSQPDRLLRYLAEELLTEVCSTANLNSLMFTDRKSWSDSLTRRLQDRVRSNRLGVSALAVIVSDVRPPDEVWPAYLDVQNAEIETLQQSQDATSAARTELVRMEMMSCSEVADARAAAASRLTHAESIAHFVNATAGLASSDWDGVRHRLFNREMAEALGRKAVVLVDQNLSPEVRLWMPGEGQRRQP
ncbi:MAG: SPFH domain-containing protein [Pirellulales bacterium]